LGIGSALTGIPNDGSLPSVFRPEDYFRFSCGTGQRSITTSASAAVCFSFDGGATDVAQFNQDNNAGGNASADRNDWIYADSGCPAAAGPYVQDAIECVGETAPLLSSSTPEMAALSTLGYDDPPIAVSSSNAASVPEPAALALFVPGLALLQFFRAGRSTRIH
jgi:hypothetical protein